MAKAGSEALSVPVELRSRVALVYPIIIASAGLASLRALLKEAAKTGSKRNPARIAHMRGLLVTEEAA